MTKKHLSRHNIISMAAIEWAVVGIFLTFVYPVAGLLVLIGSVVLGGYWAFLNTHVPPPVARPLSPTMEWELHNGHDCDTCGVTPYNQPHPLDAELRSHVLGCKCQRCLRRRADQLKAKVMKQYE